MHALDCSGNRGGRGEGVQNRQLFDIAADPWEMKNLAELPEMKETVAQLDLMMRMLLNQAGDPLDLTKPDWGWTGTP